jgi:hypothetical protein
VKYTIDLTEDQAATVGIACELLARVGIGQVREVLRHVQHLDGVKNNIANEMALREMMETVGADLTGVRNGGPGIHHKSLPQRIRGAWDVAQVVRHRLALDRLAPGEKINFMGVQYEDPVRAGDEPLPTIKAVP